MITVRLFVDGHSKGWAIVKCEACRAVCQFPALEAFDAPVRCKCGERMIVRELLMSATAHNPKATSGMIASFKEACFGRPAPAFAA